MDSERTDECCLCAQNCPQHSVYNTNMAGALPELRSVHDMHAGSILGKGNLEDTGPSKMNRLGIYVERRRTFCEGEGLHMSS